MKHVGIGRRAILLHPAAILDDFADTAAAGAVFFRFAAVYHADTWPPQRPGARASVQRCNLDTLRSPKVSFPSTPPVP